MRIGIVAGEASGDLLASGLIQAIRQRHPDAQFEGIAGPQMEAAGCKALFASERLAVMGLVEVLGHLRELLRIRRQLREHFLRNPPDLFIGVDAPDFNLALERKLKQASIPTVHYVSPSVWAWRQYRLKKIAKSVDLMLTLFPFEADYYRAHRVPVRFVGHPLADLIPDQCNRDGVRKALGLAAEGRVVALLPGSRRSELRYLAEPFLLTARWLAARVPDVRFLVPMVSAGTREQFEQMRRQLAPELDITVLDGQSREAMCAADAVLLASGTATLECLLMKRPMAVAYRMSPITYWLAKRLLTVPYYSLPNNLAHKALVPEFTQREVTPARLGSALLSYLEGHEKAQEMQTSFAAIHRELRRDASASAAQAVLELVDQNPKMATDEHG